MKPVVLVLNDMTPDRIARFSESYTPLYAPTPAERLQLLRHHAADIVAVVTNGARGLSAEQMAILPRLEIICCQGAGYEAVDLPAARGRGVVVTHGPGTNASSVADHAMALMLAAARGIPQGNEYVHSGGWDAGRTMRAGIFGKRLGILGLGVIGGEIARRAAGFEMDIGYHNRREIPGSAYHYAASVRDLAERSDFLVVVAPGGAATYHIVDGPVLAALGPAGYIVNVGRGSVIDTDALVDAIKEKRIAGAALDVVEGEPDVPPGLLALPNVILTPHVAGRSPESVKRTLQLMLDNLAAHFNARPVLTPVPG